MSKPPKSKYRTTNWSACGGPSGCSPEQLREIANEYAQISKDNNDKIKACNLDAGCLQQHEDALKAVTQADQDYLANFDLLVQPANTNGLETLQQRGDAQNTALAGSIALTATENNRLLHPKETTRLKALAPAFAKKLSAELGREVSEGEALVLLTASTTTTRARSGRAASSRAIVVSI